MNDVDTRAGKIETKDTISRRQMVAGFGGITLGALGIVLDGSTALANRRHTPFGVKRHGADDGRHHHRHEDHHHHGRHRHHR